MGIGGYPVCRMVRLVTGDGTDGVRWNTYGTSDEGLWEGRVMCWTGWSYPMTLDVSGVARCVGRCPMGRSDGSRERRVLRTHRQKDYNILYSYVASVGCVVGR